MQERASHADRHAVRAALSTAIGAGVHAAAVGASAAAPSIAGVSTVGSKGILGVVLGGKFMSGLLVGAALGTAGFATSVAVQSQDRAQLVQPARLVRPLMAPRAEPKVAKFEAKTFDTPFDVPTPAVATESASTESASTESASTESATLAAPERPRSVAARPVTEHGSETTSPTRRLLAEETAALAEVRDALSGKDAERALSLLGEQDRRFSVGQLAEERAAAKVLALCSAGRIAEAAAARAAFIASHPNSPLAKRVSLGCGGP
jgi:hypothetical protein